MREEEYKEFFDIAINYCRENEGSKELLLPAIRHHYSQYHKNGEMTPQEINSLASMVVDGLNMNGRVEMLPKSPDHCHPYEFYKILSNN